MMSAFLVTKEHIDYLVAAAIHHPRRMGPFRWRHLDNWHELQQGDRKRASEVGAMLWRENDRSVAYRYDAADEPPPDYTYAGPLGGTDPIQVLKAIHCLEYQSCEHPEWKTSEARAFCKALEHEAIQRLPGYDKADWCIVPKHLAAVK